MDKIIINGGKKLSGSVTINGSKNASLPILIATLLTDEECIVENVPDLKDIDTVLILLNHLGKKITRKGRKVHVASSGKLNSKTPYDQVKKMRASALVMGPMLARLGHVEVSLPGGCAIGSRPVNLHLEGFKKLGAVVNISDGYVRMKAGRLKGAKIYFDFPSVGATENLMLAAVYATGKTVIENAACEPEIKDLADFLVKMGAVIKGAGTSIIRIQGVRKLRGARHSVIPDRIEAGTYMIAAAITRGSVLLKNMRAVDVEPLIEKLRASGVVVDVINDGEIRVSAGEKLKTQDIKTSTFPGFPTDMQAQWMAFMSTVKGSSIITETVFENRFLHVAELCRMGAEIRIEGNSAFVEGASKLSGAPVMASDLRASAALILAGLFARGRTEVSRVYHLDRGYEKIENKLTKLGADIKRVKKNRV